MIRHTKYNGWRDKVCQAKSIHIRIHDSATTDITVEEGWQVSQEDCGVQINHGHIAYCINLGSDPEICVWEKKPNGDFGKLLQSMTLVPCHGRKPIKRKKVKAKL